MRILLVLVLCLPARAFADTVTLEVPPSLVMHDFVGGQMNLAISQLNGTKLSGQSLSLDLILANDLLMRFYTGQTPRFGLSFSTDAPSFPGFAQSPELYLIRQDGTPATDPVGAGAGSGSNGVFSMGGVGYKVSNPYWEDFKGINFNFAFPDTGYTVTNARFGVTLDTNTKMLIGTAEQLEVPEPASVGLLAVGLLTLLARIGYPRLAARRRLRLQRGS